MSEWSTYGLSDFLLFSPRTYFRLVELYNLALWPGQVLAMLAGLAIVAVFLRAGTASDRALLVLLAAGWSWVAWAWFAERYATINWAAGYVALAFAAEAALLIAMAWRGGWRAATRIHWAGLLLILFGLFVQPLIGMFAGRSWGQVELFGVMPDPTAVASLGVLLAAHGWAGRVAMVVPLGWCAATGATLLAMDEPDAWVAPLAGLLASVAAAASLLSHRHSDAAARDDT